MTAEHQRGARLAAISATMLLVGTCGARSESIEVGRFSTTTTTTVQEAAESRCEYASTTEIRVEESSTATTRVVTAAVGGSDLRVEVDVSNAAEDLITTDIFLDDELQGTMSTPVDLGAVDPAAPLVGGYFPLENGIGAAWFLATDDFTPVFRGRDDSFLLPLADAFSRYQLFIGSLPIEMTDSSRSDYRAPEIVAAGEICG